VSEQWSHVYNSPWFGKDMLHSRHVTPEPDGGDPTQSVTDNGTALKFAISLLGWKRGPEVLTSPKGQFYESVSLGDCKRR
jgi:hypothetical protein